MNNQEYKKKLTMRLFTRRLFIRNISQKYNNQCQERKKGQIVCNFCKRKSHYFFTSLRKTQAATRNMVPATNRNVNRQISSIPLTDAICGSIKTRTYHAAARFIKSSEIISNQIRTFSAYRTFDLLSNFNKVNKVTP